MWVFIGRCKKILDLRNTHPVLLFGNGKDTHHRIVLFQCITQYVC